VLLRQGEVAFDGPTQEAIAAYRRLLAADANPEELEAGLREWGSGEARILSAQLLDASGEERSQFAAGEPLTVRIVVAADANVPAPRVALELRDDGGLVLASTSRPTAELGWDGAAGERELRFSIARLPLADGRFHVRVALTDPVNGHPLHALDDALRLFVFPAGDASGAVLFEGTWTMEETGSSTPIPHR
jgi:hypothetical protein